MQLTKSIDEQAKFDFVSGLMKYNSTGIGKAMTELFLDNEPNICMEKSVIDSIGEFMNDTAIYKFGAFFELNNHALMFQAVLDILEKRREDVVAWLESYNQSTALGSVILNDDVHTPPYYKNINIHTQPGNYQAEFAGFLYHWMIGPFLVHRDDKDEMGWQLANGVPQKAYKDILDMGCGIGKSTFPYCDLYPDANVVGIDYSASMLKYGHHSKLSAFLLDSTGRRMSDPFIPGFFKEDRVEMFKRGGFLNAKDTALPNELTGWGTNESYFFGSYPWWMTIGEK
jgi:hypothetical protein